jgi:hypothetical protein
MKIAGVKKAVRSRQGMVLLGVVFVVVLIFVGTSTFFSALGDYSLSVGTTPKVSSTFGTGAELDEANMITNGDNLYVLLFGHGDFRDTMDGYQNPADSTMLELLCTENDVVVGNGDSTLYYTVIHEDGLSFFDIVPVFRVDISGVYEGSHEYKIVMSGEIEGTTFVFKILGDEDSPVYPTDGDGDGDGGDDGTLPTEPVWSETPSDVTFDNNTPSGFVLSWIAEDDNFITYELLYNGTHEDSGTINDIEYTYNLDLDLGPGVYVFNLTLTDADGNSISDEVTITVTGDSGGEFDFEEWIQEPMNMMIVLVVAVMVLGGGGAASRRY